MDIKKVMKEKENLSPRFAFLKISPNAHLAHLVFADTQIQPEKPKELNFAIAKTI
jgi:hypothetical protein